MNTQAHSKRLAFLMAVRCIWNGADTFKRLWLAEDITATEALEKMRRYVPQHERNGLRLLSMMVDADQTRPSAV